MLRSMPSCSGMSVSVPSWLPIGFPTHMEARRRSNLQDLHAMSSTFARRQRACRLRTPASLGNSPLQRLADASIRGRQIHHSHVLKAQVRRDGVTASHVDRSSSHGDTTCSQQEVPEQLEQRHTIWRPSSWFLLQRRPSTAMLVSLAAALPGGLLGESTLWGNTATGAARPSRCPTAFPCVGCGFPLPRTQQGELLVSITRAFQASTPGAGEYMRGAMFPCDMHV